MSLKLVLHLHSDRVKMKTKIYYILFFLVTLSFPVLSQTVIVNSSNSVSQLSKATLRNIYLGNTSNWENSKQIIITDYVASNELRNSFSETYLNLSPKRVSMIWIKVSLSGKTVPPKVFHTEEEIIKYVAENDGAIGYIASSTNLPRTIKIIQVQ